MDFSQLPISEPVLQGIRDNGFTTCTPIQALTLPLTLAGRDVAGQAKTGTGKTAAYLIGCFSRLLTTATPPAHHPGRSAPRCLVIAPTRELAVQIEQDARGLGAHTGFTIGAVYGGVDYEKQRTLLTDGGVDILIGTPGRLIDYLKQKAWSGSHVEALVIDEADRLFDMGFIADIRYMLRRMPAPDQRLSMLFSATLSYRAQELSYEHMNDPEVVAVASDVKTADQVTQVLYHVEGRRKISLLVGILKRDLAENESGPGGRVMIFVNTKRMGEKLEGWLTANGIPSGYLSGDVPQAKRLKVLQRFQQGEIPVLIATDVAGRGLHIEGVTHVINYDLPDNAEDYVHRIGRTARAGATGDAISLVDEDGAYCLEAVESYIQMKIPSDWAPDELFAKLERPERTPRSETEEVRRHRRGPGTRHHTERHPGERRSPGRGSRPGARDAAPAETPSTPVEGQSPPPGTGGDVGPGTGDAALRRRRPRRDGGKGAPAGGDGGGAVAAEGLPTPPPGEGAGEGAEGKRKRRRRRRRKAAAGGDGGGEVSPPPSGEATPPS